MTKKAAHKPDKLDKLTRTVERGFAAVADEFAAVRKEMATGFEDIRKEMREGFESTREDIAEIRAELKDIKAQLKALEEAVANHAGHSKEIDHAFERIAAIERHLGIRPKTRAR